MPYGGIPSAPGPIPSAGPTGPGSNEIDRIRGYVTAFFPVYETRVTPNSVVFLVAADPTTLESSFDKLRREMWAKSYVPFLRYQAGEYSVEVYPKPPMGRAGIVWNVILLAATISTTVFAGSLVWLSYVGGASLTITDFAWGALEFAFPILGILGLHELAHFITAKRHHVDASLPFFLPVPPPILFGTFGAFISIREPIPDRKTLLDIGASGPIAGFVVAIPVTLFGLFLSAHSPVIPLNNCGVTVLGLNYSSLAYGLSLFWVALSQFVPISYANLSPVALAGWVGLFVTAINLLPAGTLDGGHVFRALFGDRARYVSWGAVLLLFALGFYTLYLGWLLFGLLIFLLGLRHPPPLNDISPLDAKRWAVGGLAVVILISLFVVVPIAEPTGQFALTNVQSANLTPPSGYAMAANVSADIANHDFVEHGYYPGGSISSVTATINGSTVPLSGPQLTAFENNSTWIVYLPNGTVETFTDQASFTLPASSYVTVGAGGQTPMRVTYLNAEQATVVLTLSTYQLCASNYAGPSSNSVNFTVA